MLNQFAQLIDKMNKDKKYSENTLNVYTTNITNRLEELGFIGKGLLNNFKYIYTKRPAFAFQEGNYINNRKINKKTDFRTDKFLNTLIRLDYLIHYDSYYPYSNISHQLLEITKEAYSLIKNNNNKNGYDLKTIEKIIELETYEKISLYLSKYPEYKNKLGIIRTLWAEIGKEFWKLSRQGHSISDKPLYLKIFILDDGEIVLHYVPEIVIFDTARNLEYYKKQSNNFFHLFLDITNNKTQHLQKNFIDTKELGYDHFNRIGYTCLLIGTNETQLKIKAGILNKHYNQENDYHPLVSPCRYICLDTDKYLKQGSTTSIKNKSFIETEKKIEETLKSLNAIESVNKEEKRTKTKSKNNEEKNKELRIEDIIDCL